ncbi:hypothetical protein ACS0TY_028064 [Phlomoides rotata]
MEGGGQVTKSGSSFEMEQQPTVAAEPMRNIILVAAIAAGIQFGWALQLSLLTPYVQLLGIPHKWAPYIWLCGPVSGLLVQPIVGYYSDICTSRFGRRRPFIATGTALVVMAVVMIGFAADIGYAAGDSLESTPRYRAISLFVIGFWILDVANNMLQGPCRALLADLSAGNTKKTETAFALFSFFMAVGNILGYSAGSYTHLYQLFPFSKTEACDVYCANLKSCFLIAICLLAGVTITALAIVGETPLDPAAQEVSDAQGKGKIPVFSELFSAFKHLSRAMWILLLVTALNWIGWFPFLLFDTDWMGKEVYGGTVGEGKLYDQGVRAGALGLMLNSVVLGIASLGVDLYARGSLPVKKLWGVVNFILGTALAMTVVVSKWADHSRQYDAAGVLLPPDAGVKFAALSVFAVLGIPLAVTFSIPFALASIFSTNSGVGQGLSLGVLNLAIVVPQMIVSMTSGPIDAMFGGGNLPAFVCAAIAAIISGVLALTTLPSPPSESLKAKIVAAGGFH